ncbi:MAG: acetyl-CoA carboxylase biotin carboxyl carrier protein [Planctomycetota bacterium]
MMDTLELLVERTGDRTRLRSPEVGFLAGTLPAGSVLTPGQQAGTIETLGRARALVVPGEVGGRIVSESPALARSPVGYGDVVYEIEAIAAGSGIAPSPPRAAVADARGLVLTAPQAGRFYHRPAPGDAPFVAVGAIVEDGETVGMIEVMKTFSHVPYRASGSLPRRAKVLRAIAADGADVKRGDPLLEVEPA